MCSQFLIYQNVFDKYLAFLFNTIIIGFNFKDKSRGENNVKQNKNKCDL